MCTHTQKKSALKNEEEETGRIESLLDIHLEEKKKKKKAHIGATTSRET